MSFGLKNTGATYQRAIQACLKEQLNKNVEDYMDNVVVKIRNSNTLITDLEETFASLREYRWKLNQLQQIRELSLHLQSLGILLKVWGSNY
jgi:hypothetical protein